MSEGYVYCLSNESMPGILKVGMTERTPEERIKELFTTGVPSPFKIEFAKKVKDPKSKEASLHILLEQYTDRIYTRREFFRVSPEKVRKFFDLMDGEMWAESRIVKNDDGDSSSGSESVPTLTTAQYQTVDPHKGQQFGTSSDGQVSSKYNDHHGTVVVNTLVLDGTTNVIGCRDMKKCFKDGQRIRHTIGVNNTWMATYNSSLNTINYYNLKDGKLNSGSAVSLNKFAENHYKSDRPDRVSAVNAWKECECEVDGKWISTYSLPG
jgi:hypothetical protein